MVKRLITSKVKRLNAPREALLDAAQLKKAEGVKGIEAVEKGQ
jgi:hypothetical protein